MGMVGVKGEEICLLAYMTLVSLGLTLTLQEGTCSLIREAIETLTLPRLIAS